MEDVASVFYELQLPKVLLSYTSVVGVVLL